mgnify:FL=1
MELPVFIINGFLESGKTAFIKDTLKGEDFNDGTRSLIIACEDGEEEYSEIEMQKVNAKVVFVEDMDEFTKDFFISKCNESKAERVFVEFNGMWNLGDFIDKLPSFMPVAQIITLVNAETYDMYLANMKQLMMEQYKLSEMVIINRCTKDSDRAAYRRSVKAVNRCILNHRTEVPMKLKRYCRLTSLKMRLILPTVITESGIWMQWIILKNMTVKLLKLK